jgi:hypothetical protein
MRGGEFNETLVDDFLAQPHPPPPSHDAFQFGHVRNELHQLLEAQHGPPGAQGKDFFIPYIIPSAACNHSLLFILLRMGSRIPQSVVSSK